MTYLTRELNRMLAGKPAQRPALQSHWEIHWEDGEVGQVRKHGREWSWWCRSDSIDGAKTSGCRAYSSHLDGIRDHLSYNRKNGLISGELVRVKNS